MAKNNDKQETKSEKSVDQAIYEAYVNGATISVVADKHGVDSKEALAMIQAIEARNRGKK